MAAGRSCLIITLPMIGTLVAIVLGIIAFLGSAPKTTALDNIYFMRLNFTHISASSFTGLSGAAAEEVDTAINAVISELGIPGFYSVGATGYCQGNITGDSAKVSNCSTPTVPFWFDLVTILEDHLPAGVSINLPDKVQDYSKVLHAASSAIWVCYVAGIAISVIELITGFFSFHSRVASCCAGIIGIIAAILFILASGLATGVFKVYTSYFNDEFNSFGVSASMGSTAFVLTWIATAASVWSAAWWIISICFGSTRHSKSYEEEKQPFIGYVPHPPRNY